MGYLRAPVPIDVIPEAVENPDPRGKDCAHCLLRTPDAGQDISSCSDVGSASIGAWAAAILVESATRALSILEGKYFIFWD